MNDHSKIRQILDTQFEKELFEASLYSLHDQNNKLRYNNFAYSIRELSRHFLDRLSPDKNVKACSWYIEESNNGKPTRTQRIKYAIQGGVSDALLVEWGFEVDELNETIKDIKSTIDILSKYTHINPDVFDLSEIEVNRNSKNVLKAFETFVQTINDYRNEIKRFLDGHIEEQMIHSVVSNFFENVDQLAPHHSVDFCDVNDYHISGITDKEIIVDVSGDLHVTLHYGSSKERREGDGLDLGQSFPFETRIKYEIHKDFPTNRYGIDDYDVDVSDWYGDNEED